MMKRNLGTGALLGAVLTAPLMALMYLADKLVGLPFVPFDIFDWIARVLPGAVVTFGIDAMINTLLFLKISVADAAKTAEQLIALTQFFVMGVIMGAVAFAVMKPRITKPDLLSGLVIGALFGLPAMTISVAVGSSSLHPILIIVWLLVLFLGWGLAFNAVYARLLYPKTSPGEVAPEMEGDEKEMRGVQKLNRRQFLILVGTSAATITVVGSGVGAVLASTERRKREEELGDTLAHNVDETSRSPFPNADDPVMSAPGTRPEYTPVKDHYKVFLKLEPEVIDGASWMLPITGLVDNPLMLTLDDFRTRWEPRDQYVTLSCISGRIGTTLISTTHWTGVSVQDVLATAQVRPEARYLFITSADGFYETVSIDLINSDERIMFCYAWDGNTLPTDHGFPLRIWIPDRFGMKQPKWITGIEVTDKYREGYWVERHWSETAMVKTTSVIDTVAVNAIIENGDQRLVPVGGIAFSGDKQISKVEVRVDEGNWAEAELRSPLSETTWVIWRYEWPFQAGEHTFEVRCYDGAGNLQIMKETPARPDGATGVHSKEANI